MAANSSGVSDAAAQSVAGISRHTALGAAFLCGAGWLGTEITAVRAFAPWFGTSAPVWSNVIAVLLAAGAAGALLGGRMTRCGQLRARAVLVGGGACVTLVLGALLVPWIAEGLVLPVGSTPPETRSALTLGSLALSLSVLATPVMCMSALTPLLVSYGKQSLGALLTASTCGGLLAVFAVNGAALHALGPRGVLSCAAVCYALVVLLLTRGSWRGIALCLFVLAGFFMNAAAGPDARAWPADGTADAEVERLLLQESDYQHLHLSRVRTDQGRTELRLALDEGLGEFHSLRVEGQALTGQYYDTLALAALTACEQRTQPQTLILGGGAGTLTHLLRSTVGARLGAITSVELDPAVIAAAAAMGTPTAPCDRVLAADARRCLAALDQRFDLIVLDAFARQLAIPAHLFTREFLELARSHLAPMGLCAVNVSTQDLESPLMRALLATLQEQFASIEAISVPGAWSVILLCSVEPGRNMLPLAAPAGLQSVLISARGVRWTPSAASTARVLTDDLAPLDQLARDR